MGLKLHREIGWIVSHAWSFRFLVLAMVLSGAEAVLPLFIDHPPLPRRIFSLLVFVIVAAAMLARVIVQQRPPVVFSDDPVPAPAPSDTTVQTNALTVQLCAATTMANCATVQAPQ